MSILKEKNFPGRHGFLPYSLLEPVQRNFSIIFGYAPEKEKDLRHCYYFKTLDKKPLIIILSKTSQRSLKLNYFDLHFKIGGFKSFQTQRESVSYVNQLFFERAIRLAEKNVENEVLKKVVNDINYNVDNIEKTLKYCEKIGYTNERDLYIREELKRHLDVLLEKIKEGMEK